jgi:hypothetical protein
MTSLYVLANEFKALEAKLLDSDYDEQTVADTLEGFAGDLEVKAVNVAMFSRNLDALANQIREAEKEMAERRRAVEKKAENIRRYLLQNMERTGINKITCPYFEISLKKNPPSLVIDDENKLPLEFMRIPPLPDPVPDKKAILDAIKSGKEVAGAHIVQNNRVDIK